MRLFGYEITKAAPPAALQTVHDRGRWWWPVVKEPFTGAWQRNIAQSTESVLTYHAVYACVTLIAADVAKCRARIVEKSKDGIWIEKDVPAFSPVLRKPNRYQNRIKFFEQWIVSKLLHGNTYVLKSRDDRKVVNGLYILDPKRVKAFVAANGDVYYHIYKDNLSGVTQDDLYIPASEIIHDVMVPLYHPLCGVSPLTACGVAAAQGLAIQNHSAKFFANGAQPSGILTAPGDLSDDQAKSFKEAWEANYTGENAGRVAVLGGGLKYEAMSMKSTDAQLIEQLKWSAETVCSAFHVPAYKVGVGAPPAYNNIEALERQYYAQCLQTLFECIELCLDDGLGLTAHADHIYGVEFDLDDLLRMDTATLTETLTKQSGAGLVKLDEARKRLNLPPMPGGDAAYLQQQNYSVVALAKRDAKEDPFGTSQQEQPAAPEPKPEPVEPPPAPAKKINPSRAVAIFEAA